MRFVDDLTKVITDGIDRSVLRVHAPIETGDPTEPLVCTNHWRPHVRPWPCDVVIEVQERRAHA